MDNKIFVLAILVVLILIIIIVIVRNYNNVKQKDEISHIIKKFPISQSKPTFLRHDSRPFVKNDNIQIKEYSELPANLNPFVYWENKIGPPTDQGNCGSCWAFSSTSEFSDRIRIKTDNQALAPDNNISPYCLAACMKCNNKTGVCTKVCEGHYLDEVHDFMTQHEIYTNRDMKKITKTPTEYNCYKPEGQITGYVAKKFYRVNQYSMNELTNDKIRDINARSIMQDILENGPVTTVVKVFNPTSKAEMHKNFYLYKTGIYGHGWKKDPIEYDGYHAINIIGWGVENIDGENVPYWLLRNSWGREWGENGYGKIVRGKNLAVIECDVWATTY